MYHIKYYELIIDHKELIFRNNLNKVYFIGMIGLPLLLFAKLCLTIT